MIGKLRGIILDKQPPRVTLDVGGIGYDIFAPMSTFYTLPQEPDQVVSLFTHLVVREDELSLYGFFQEDERRLFRALIKVNGVGPKLALTVLSSIEASSFVHCVLENNTALLTQVPGIGKKTAERLVIDMRDVVKRWPQTTPDNTPMAPRTSQADDAVDALITLGYKPAEAKRMVEHVAKPDLSSEALIRAALKTVTS